MTIFTIILSIVAIIVVGGISKFILLHSGANFVSFRDIAACYIIPFLVIGIIAIKIIIHINE